MKKLLVALALLWCAPAQSQILIAQPNGTNVQLSASCTGVIPNQVCTPNVVVSNFNGLQYGLAQNGLGTPAGAMSGYSYGDTITLQCTGVTFITSPVVAAIQAPANVVASAGVINPGITSGTIPSTSVNCSQAATSGSGTGYITSAVLGLYAAYVAPASLITGSLSTNLANGNYYLNVGPADGSPQIAVGGSENTFIGDKAGYAFNGQSNWNTAVGHNALGNGGTQSASVANTAVGNDAGRNLQGTSGNNTLIGWGAGRNVSGGWNTFIGSNTGSTSNNGAGSVTGSNNVGFGYQAALSLVGGSGNTCLGTKACSAITNGNGNIIISAPTGPDNCANGNESNVIALCGGGAGRSLTITGTNITSTSVATFAGVVSGFTVTSSPIVSTANQVSYGGTTFATSNCGSIAGAAGCIAVNIAGTLHFIPFF